MTKEEIAELITTCRTEEATEAIDKLTEEAPEDPDSWLLAASHWESLGDIGSERDAIARGMAVSPRHYEFFYMLGLIYRYHNINQAYLCMEQALFFCEHEEDRGIIRAELEALRQCAGFCVRNFSVVILSYNDKELMQHCVEAFRRDCPKGAYEFVVVENHSDDGVAEWLREQTDIRLIENGENVGFPVGCNIGFRAANEDNDLLMINNDAVPAPNAVFWLRMGLYENHNVGATGAVSNKASMQFVEGAPDTLEECMTFGAKRNVPRANPYEDRCRLTGFAFMLRREACEAVRMDKDLFDTRFSPGYFEDDDLGMRVAKAGYRQVVCHNAFIYHRGGSGFAGNDDAMTESRQKFIDKWGFDVWAYEGVWYEMIDLIDVAQNAPLNVLQLYCGMGADLSRIKYLYPFAYVAGIDPDPVIAGHGRYMGDLFAGNAEAADYPWSEGFFDFIIAADAVKNAEAPEAFVKKLASYLRPDGAILYEIPRDEGWQACMERIMTEAGFTERFERDGLVRARRKGA
ncbi:MAG: glycosyltransferase [Lachnospiraceae bacterium]|nr:glycosyltransferase [Lachnospiraceae bacterium]